MRYRFGVLSTGDMEEERFFGRAFECQQTENFAFEKRLKVILQIINNKSEAKLRSYEERRCTKNCFFAPSISIRHRFSLKVMFYFSTRFFSVLSFLIAYFYVVSISYDINIYIGILWLWQISGAKEMCVLFVASCREREKVHQFQI
jgi:hypothetical protein